MTALEQNKARLVDAHRAQNWELARLLSQERERLKFSVRKFCGRCGQPLSASAMGNYRRRRVSTGLCQVCHRSERAGVRRRREIAWPLPLDASTGKRLNLYALMTLRDWIARGLVALLLITSAAAQPLPPGLRGNLVMDTNQPGIAPHVATPGYASVTLAWDPVTNNVPPVVGYRVYYSTNSGAYDASQRQEVEGETANSLSVTGLLYGTHYWFVAVSVGNMDTESAYSQEVDWVTDGPPLTNFFLTISAQQGSSPGGPFTNVGDLFTITNPAAPALFWRVGITRTNFNPDGVSGLQKRPGVLVPVGAKKESP